MKKLLYVVVLMVLSMNLKADQLTVISKDDYYRVVDFFDRKNIDEVVLYNYGEYHYQYVKDIKVESLDVSHHDVERFKIKLTGVDLRGNNVNEIIDLAYVYVKNGNNKGSCLGVLLHMECYPEIKTISWSDAIALDQEAYNKKLEEQKKAEAEQSRIAEEQAKQEKLWQREKEKNDMVMLVVVIVFVSVALIVFKRYRENKKAANLIEVQKREERLKQEAEKAAIQKKEEDIRYAKYLEDKRKQEEIDRAEALEKERKLEEERKKHEQERLAKELAHKKQLEEERKKQEEARIAKELEEKKKLEEERIEKELTAKRKLEEEKKRQEEERIAKELAEKKKKEDERLRLEEERNNNGYFIEVEENNAFVLKGPFTPEEIKSKLEKGEIVLTTMMKKGIKTDNLKPLHGFSEFNTGLDGFL